MQEVIQSRQSWQQLKEKPPDSQGKESMQAIAPGGQTSGGSPPSTTGTSLTWRSRVIPGRAPARPRMKSPMWSSRTGGSQLHAGQLKQGSAWGSDTGQLK